MKESATRSSIQVIDRMMSLLEALAGHAAPANLKQLAADSRLHPSTAHRILSVMVGNRLVDRIEPGTYRLGTRLLELGNLVRARIGIRDEALPFMQELQAQIGNAVHLAVRHHDAVICVEQVAANRQATHAPQAGGAPLHATAAGKIFLGDDSREERDAYVKRSGSRGDAGAAPADPAALMQELDAARESGYAFDGGGAHNGVSCVAAGIRGNDGRLLAALCVCAPAQRFDKAWAAPVRHMAERISRALGHAAPAGR